MMDNPNHVITGMTNLSIQDFEIGKGPVKNSEQVVSRFPPSLMGSPDGDLNEPPSRGLIEDPIKLLHPPPPLSPSPDLWNVANPNTFSKEPFVALVDVGNATPLDVTIVLYANRVLMAEAVPHGVGADGNKNPVVHRWCLPANVDEDSIRSFLGDGKLLIAAFPLPENFDWPYQMAPALLGPPLRTAWPCPIMRC